jgi:hypothetical protein
LDGPGVEFRECGELARGEVGEGGQDEESPGVFGGAGVGGQCVVEASDQAGDGFVEAVGFFADQAEREERDGAAGEQSWWGAAAAGVAVGVEALRFRVAGVEGEHVAVGLEADELKAVVVAVGGDRVERAVVEVDPRQLEPQLGIPLVGGDQTEVGRVNAGWVTEGVNVGMEEEVEGLDLLGPGSTGVVGGEGAGDLVGCERNPGEGGKVEPVRASMEKHFGVVNQQRVDVGDPVAVVVVGVERVEEMAKAVLGTLADHESSPSSGVRRAYRFALML